MFENTYLEASAAPKELRICGESEPLEIQAAESPDKPKKFSMVAYTGAAMKVGFGWPVVVDLEGMNVPSQNRPILRSHDAERIVGHTETVEVTKQRIRVSGVLSGVGDDVAEIAGTAANGFPWQASIGCSIEKMEFVESNQNVKVNGRNFTGPVYVARATTLGEVSFVALGADGATSAAIAASQYEDRIMTFEEWLKAKNIEASALTESVKDVLRAQYKLEQTPPAPVAAPVAKAITAAAPESDAAKGLSGVIEAQRRENARTEGITELVAKSCAEQPMRLDEFEAIGREAISAKWDLDKTENKLLVASIKAGGAPSVFAPSKPETSAKVIEAAVCLAANLSSPEKAFDERTLEAAHKNFGSGIGLMEMVDICARQRGFRGNVQRNLRDALKAAFSGSQINAAMTSSVISIDGILSNVANKFVRESFMYVENEYSKISAKRSVRDFKQISSYSLTGDLTYELISGGGEIKHGTLGDETYNNQAYTYGKLLGISRTDLINDDLGALSTVAKRLGRGGALKVNDVFWASFLDNGSFFTTGNGNYDDGTDTVVTNDGLVAADIFWQAMTDPDGKPMGHMAKYLVVPPNLRIPALRLMNSQSFAAADEEGTSNPWAGMFEVVSSKYLNNSSFTGYSTKAWYLLCDPNDIPVIEICYLNGQEMPTIETADLDFDRLGIALRGYHDFGVAKQEPRGGFKFKGEA
jgi:hypothetical protein